MREHKAPHLKKEYFLGFIFWQRVFLFCLLTIGEANISWGAFPSQFVYQGSLKQNGVPVNGTYPMEFRITNIDGTQTYWASGVQNVSIQEGLYRVELAPTGVDWSNIEPYMQMSVSGNQLLPREKLSSTPYAWMARDLAPGAVAKGDLSVVGKVGIGTSSPLTKLHILDNALAGNQAEMIYSAESTSPGNPFQLHFAFRSTSPALQSFQVGTGNHNLLLNPDGGKVGVGTESPGAQFTIKNGLGNAPYKINNLFGAGYNNEILNGNRQFWIQQWLNPVTARTFLIGNGYISPSNGGSPLPNTGPYSDFQAFEFNDHYFGLMWTAGNNIDPGLILNSTTGRVGIGTTNPVDKLHVDGGMIVNGAIKSEQNMPAFFVNVYLDDCGWSHPYLGCPQGYASAGKWHTGPARCDGMNEGQGHDNGDLDSGWLTLCVAQ